MALVIELGEQGYWALATSPYALEEARRNLDGRFPHSLDGLGTLVLGVRSIDHHPALPFPAELTAKDRPIFQAAVAWDATHLLTGDLRDFGAFMNKPEKTFGIVVQTVADFLRSRSTTESG